MTGIEVARAVVAGGVHQVRPRKDAPGQYDARPGMRGKKKGWAYLDHVTASAIVAVYDALTPENRAKMESLRLDRAAHIALTLINRHGRIAS